MSKSRFSLIGRILGITLLSLLGLVILCLSLVLLVWMKPQLIITENNIRKALHYAPNELQVRWQSLNFEFEKPDFWSKHVVIKSKNLCIQFSPLLDTCLNEINLEFDFSLRDFKFNFLQISEVKVDLNYLVFKQGPPSTPSTPEEMSILPDLRLPKFESILPAQFDFTKIRTFEIIFNKVTIYPFEAEPINLQGRLDRHDIIDDQEMDLVLQLEASQPSSFSVKTINDILITKQSLEIRGQNTFKHSLTSVITPLHLRWSDHLSADLVPQIVFKKIKLHPELQIFWSSDKIDLQIRKISSRTIWPQGTIALNHCAASADLENKQGFPEKIRIDCSGMAIPKHRIFEGYENLQARVLVDLSLAKSKFSFSEKVLLSGLVRLEATHSLVKGFIESDGEFIFSNIRQFELAKAQSKITTDLTVPEIQVWRKIFERSKISIPAPLNVLSGPTHLAAELQITDLLEPVTGRATLTTDFKSKTQKLKTETHVEMVSYGNLKNIEGVDIQVDAKLQEIVLDAPALNYEAPPQLLPDKRFVTRREAKAHETLSETKEKPQDTNKFKVTWNAKVKTSKPLLINLDLLKRAIPISVDIQHHYEKGLTGFLQVEAFPVEIFKKKADIKFVKILFHEGSTVPGLNGLITYTNPEVDIKILLLGNTENPRVEFESYPELNRQQIVSVILFNKSLDELNEEEVSSASNISRAMSDGAFGLFSLIFLSSTPIQSVGYDPVSKSYNARLKIDDHTSFTMGSDFDSQRNFSVRRRLGGPWSVRTELRQASDSSDVVVTLIEWLKRF